MFRGLRFQKRLRILPGVRVNLSKSGASTSIGPRGADVNIGRDGVTTNAGIPGTGLSYRQKVGGGGHSHGQHLTVAHSLPTSPGSGPYCGVAMAAAWTGRFAPAREGRP